MIPEYLLVHSVTRIRPNVVVDEYNNEVYDYGETALYKTMQVWLQQDLRNQMTQESNAKQGRFAADQRWLLISNDDDIRWQDRIVWTEDEENPAVVFAVYSQPEPTYTPSGYHHLEATLQIVMD